MVARNDDGKKDNEDYRGSRSASLDDAKSPRSRSPPFMNYLRSNSDRYRHVDEYGLPRYGDTTQWLEQAVLQARAETRLELEREIEVWHSLLTLPCRAVAEPNPHSITLSASFV